jgi:beta-lysine 5,6-aminomutase alpha subunit
MHLTLDSSLIDRARHSAWEATGKVQQLIDASSTVSIERAVLRLMGVEGVQGTFRQGTNADEFAEQLPPDVPLVNVTVDALQRQNALQRGAAYWLGAANVAHDLSPIAAARAFADGTLTCAMLKAVDSQAAETAANALAQEGMSRILTQRRIREEKIANWGERPTPWLYVIVATGNIYEDAIQAQAAARQGADVIAIIRSTAQSLLDHVPEGATEQGFGGTYATQENFRIARAALDEVSEELGRYVRLTNYASGLCMPEIATLGAMERLDMMLSDSMYGILFRDINPLRTFIDQHFARRIQAVSGIIINTGEDNYLTTDDAFDAAHTVLASQFLNEAFAHRSGLDDAQIGLGHAFEMNPCLENQLLYQIADALLSRQCFPHAPLKYMPPTKHISGDIFMAHVINALFNLTSIATEQHIHLVGILSEGVHTPFLHDRYLALQNAEYLMSAARGFAGEFEVRPDGLIAGRAEKVLLEATHLLEEIEQMGLWSAIENGVFAGVKRPPEGGRGGDGVFARDEKYFNPVEALLPSAVVKEVI